MNPNDHHFRREDRTLHWQRIAAHLSSHPEDLCIPLANIDRWLALGRVHPAPLHEWRGRILAAQSSAAAMRQLIDYLAASNHNHLRCRPLPRAIRRAHRYHARRGAG